MPWCKEDPQSHEAVFSIHINDEPDDDKWNAELQPHRYLMKASTNPHLQLKMMRIRLLNWWCIYNINSIIKTSMQLQCQTNISNLIQELKRPTLFQWQPRTDRLSQYFPEPISKHGNKNPMFICITKSSWLKIGFQF